MILIEKYLIKIVKLLEEINAKLDMQQVQSVIGTRRRVPLRVRVPGVHPVVVRRW